ncbi:MAG TPA: hypothetical protein DIT13_03845 [Verrucomicrobiales bacterium]|nr:hypothetical protein [Verrucomicrobiales bacterium]HRK15063.1 hypothetical protein [Prosthecobacter sp.]
MRGVPDNGDVRLPREMLEALLPHMQALGMTPPDVADMVPKVRMDEPVRDLALRLGLLLKGSGLYRFGPNERLIYFDRGKPVRMTPVKFCSWVERHVEVVKTAVGKSGAYDVRVSLGKDLAAKLLEADELTGELPLIEQIVATRIPVRRRAGPLELCKVGYDEEAAIFCTNEVPFDEGWELGRALALLEDWCSEFSFAEAGAVGRDLWQNRSFVVHVSAMLGVFGRRLLPAGTVRPMVIYLANDQGSGKSLLVSMVLAACFGVASSTDLPLSSRGPNQEKFTALLETVAQSMKEYLWIDDVPPAVFSNALNRFVTASAHTGRKYGGNDEMFDAPAVTQVFMTGNNVELTRDIMQRSLVVELFMRTDSQKRTFKRRLTAMWFCSRERRGEMLSALWAFFRAWSEAGMPMGQTLQERASDWSELVGGVLEAAGVTIDPFGVPDLPMAGDRETEEWRALLTALADEAEAAPEFMESESSGRYEVDTDRIVSVARDNRLLADIVGTKDDKPLKGGELKRLGRRLAKWRGREDLVASSGRRFRFGKRKQNSNWVYPIEWLDEPRDEESRGSAD